jgi:hypothetical protein
VVDQPTEQALRPDMDSTMTAQVSKHRFVSWNMSLVIVFAILVPRMLAQSGEARINFATDIQPILANHCWSCHGPDESGRKANLRLDVRESAVSKMAIVAGDTSSSEMIVRILSNDDDTRMPPPSSKKPLSEHDRELLRAWVEQGAEYASHWAFEVPKRQPIPEIDHDEWVINPIDSFVLDRLNRENLAPSLQADRGTLIRRLSLDLTGLPPTIRELEDFLGDGSSDAYERVVDRLLRSESYAERMAMNWLDQARYADTNGYNNDEDRTMWPWRDWVIRAFHTNMPYNQFIVEQLAGDLLPNPTRDQLVATAFLRNQGHNTEGGIIAEEYRVEYVADRVHTTATVFLGLSMQCARCHDHKFDPISQAEYYQFFAIFNNLDEKQASYNKFLAAEPFIRVPSSEQESQLKLLDSELQQLQDRIVQIEQRSGELLEEWMMDHSVEEFRNRCAIVELNHFGLEESNGKAPHDSISGNKIEAVLAAELGAPTSQAGKRGLAYVFDGKSKSSLGSIGDFDGGLPFSISVWVYPSSNDGMAILSKMDEAAGYRGYDLLLEGGKLTAHLVNRWPDNAIKISATTSLALNSWHHVVLAYDGARTASSLQLFVDSKPVKVEVVKDSLSGTIATPKTFHLGLREKSLPFRGIIDELRIFRGALESKQVLQIYENQAITDVADWIAVPVRDRTVEQQQGLQKHFLFHLVPEYPLLQKRFESKSQERKGVEVATPAVMIMKERETPRETFILKRGQYDQPSERVSANFPKALASLPRDKEIGRLELAKWLTDHQNPLTARVAVNRMWQEFFGIGIVKTSEDFGTTGERPSHPELLDYLATQLVDSDWNVKALQKRIVMSATYRQESKVSSDLLDRDPENRLIARGPRFRLSAETVRDNALAISGLLKNRVGGPSVKPYQPEGLWEDVTVERKGKYIANEGEGLYRRSMYTFWKRTCPPPAMMSFDAPNREVCLSRRARTNTPLQSLVLLNDPTYVEAARSLATDLLREKNLTTIERIHLGYRRALARDARTEELEVIQEILVMSQKRFVADVEQALALLRIGATAVESSLDPVELASWTMVASMLLNLDETICKR